MQRKRCPVFVSGKECGQRLIRLDRESRRIGKHSKLAIYACSLGHRSAFLVDMKPRNKS